MPNMLACIRSVGPNFGHPTEQPKSRKEIMPFSFQFLAGRCALSNPRKPNVEQEVSLESSRVRIPTSRVRRKISHPQRRFGIGIGTRVGSMDLEYGCGDCGSRRLLQASPSQSTPSITCSTNKSESGLVRAYSLKGIAVYSKRIAGIDNLCASVASYCNHNLPGQRLHRLLVRNDDE